MKDNPSYKKKSKDRLHRIVSQKIKTTMIGAISSVEDHFGFLLEEDNPNNKEMQEIFKKLRSEILDKGNHQIRNLQKEFELYDISLNTYQAVFLPVRKIGE